MEVLNDDTGLLSGCVLEWHSADRFMQLPFLQAFRWSSRFLFGDDTMSAVGLREMVLCLIRVFFFRILHEEL